METPMHTGRQFRFYLCESAAACSCRHFAVDDEIVEAR